MKCNHCNSEIPDDSVFCEQCGTKVKKKFPKWRIPVAVLLLGVLSLVLWQVLKPKPGLPEYPEEEMTVSENKTDQTFNVGDVTFKMVFVEGGPFQMGSDSGDDDERPVHNVTVSDFYMGEFEVTQALWQEVMGTTVYQQRDKDDPSGPMRGVGVDYPMYYVNHTEAEEFCGRLNQRLRSQLPAGYSFALPTEAEWEYAARGGNKTNTYTYSGSNYLSDVAWCEDNSGESTHAVGMKRANELGLYDMSGNVWEWCEDWYSSSFYSDNRNWTDPVNTYVGSRRVLRGGSWLSHAGRCRVSYRNVYNPGSRFSYCGFRLSLVHRQGVRHGFLSSRKERMEKRGGEPRNGVERAARPETE